MERRLKLSEEESLNQRRQLECLQKYDKIVHQFHELMDMMETITYHPPPPKRRKASNPQPKKKSTTSTSSSDAGPIHSVATAAEANKYAAEVADQGGSSIASSQTKAQKTAELEFAITEHLIDLQSDSQIFGATSK